MTDIISEHAPFSSTHSIEMVPSISQLFVEILHPQWRYQLYPVGLCPDRSQPESMLVFYYDFEVTFHQNKQTYPHNLLRLRRPGWTRTPAGSLVRASRSIFF
jgi:hypothetical protein